MKETDKYYFFWKHQFGQWTIRPMVDLHGNWYNCCEQYMMANKARLFGDDETFGLIMREDNPRIQQKLGRSVKNYVQEVWDKNNERIVYDGNILKFSQHDDLRERLLLTDPKILVEASPDDVIWGVGLSADDPLILDPRNWLGENRYGKLLMRVRRDLK
jgi:hypothetical protein